MRISNVLFLMGCTVCFVTGPVKSGTTVSPCPDEATLRQDAVEEVLQFSIDEAARIEGLLNMANETRNAAREALAQCYNELESAKSLKQARLSNAGKIAKLVEHLEAQKDSSKRELDRAQQILNSAKSPHASSQQQAAAARRQANEALLKAQERSRAAALAWAEANATQQQSRHWVQGRTNAKGSLTVGVPHGLQTATSYSPQQLPLGRKVPPIQAKGSADVSKLTEIAKSAEYAAAIAESEAKRLNEIASAAERSVQTDWNNMSPSYHSFNHAQRTYHAICESYAQQKATYDAAILAINAAETIILQKKEAIVLAKANLAEELEKVPILQAQLDAAHVVVYYVRALVEQLGNSTTTAAPTTQPTTVDPPTTAAAAPGFGQSQTNQIEQLLRRFASQRNQAAVPSPARTSNTGLDVQRMLRFMTNRANVGRSTRSRTRNSSKR